jgi:exodeoxyribonuclease VIII
MIPDDPTGLHDGIDEIEYRAAPGLSASEAKVLLGKRPPAPSPALAFGTLVHTIVLEPDKAEQYVALDAVAVAGDNPKTGRPYDSPTMTSKWKAAVAEAEQGGRIVVAQTDWDAAHRMAEAVHAHPAAARVLELCDRREVSGWAKHPTGVLVKGRLDLLGPGLVADLKTCQDANPDTFGKTCHDFGYHVSAANYLDLALAAGEDVQGFCFVNVEKADPYRVSVVQLTESAIDLGRERMAEACRRWLDLGRVELPQYGEGFFTVDLPPWAYRDGSTTYEEIA